MIYDNESQIEDLEGQISEIKEKFSGEDFSELLFDKYNIKLGPYEYKSYWEQELLGVYYGILITDENKEIVKSILEVLDFYEAANNIRTRYEYVLGGVKFEIDDYIRPQAQVVAIEGEKELVDKVYEQVKNLK